MSYLEEACKLQEELVHFRRYVHQNAEVGCCLPKTTAFVMNELRKMGYEPEQICESGVTASVGRGEKGILLRADMDALPMKELSGLDFSSGDDHAAHTCGHDLHVAALLGAAKLLKAHEGELNGVVKFMFQPGEEIFKGSKVMISAGILENPRVDAAFAGHVTPRYKTGVVACRDGAALASCYGFKLHIYGKAAHGANPEDGIDPINIGVHIHMALQELIAREVNLQKGATLTIGSFHAGEAANNIPDKAELQGTLRTFNNEVRDYLIRRIETVSRLTGEMFGGKVEIEELSNVPAQINDNAMIAHARSCIKDLCGEENLKEDVLMTGSEDFAFIGEKVPSAIVFIGALDPKHQGEIFYGHHPRVMFDENVLPLCAALYAETAARWLGENK